MITDFTTIFSTPDELADFCMLPNEEQDALLAKVTAEGKTIGFEMSCDLTKKAEYAAS